MWLCSNAFRMHNPTRRVKRFKRPLSSTRPSYSLPEISDARLGVSDEDDTPGSSIHARPRPGPPNMARGAVLVALVMVTIVLYIVLWQLERPELVSVPNPNMAQRVLHGTSSTWYPNAITKDAPTLPLRAEFTPSDVRIVQTSSRPGYTTSSPWPPPVTRVPEEDDDDHTDDHTEEDAELSSFDSAYCNGTCRFLLPIRIGEQESKARAHLTDLLTLARRLNRTMVLPNVGKSRMSACSDWPFDAYYDTDGLLLAHEGGPLVIDLERFARWVHERPKLSSGFIISMTSIPRGDAPASQGGQRYDPYIVDTARVDPKILSCLRSKLARLRLSSPRAVLSISFHSGTPKVGSDTSTNLAHLLSNGLAMDTGSNLDLITGPEYERTLTYPNASHLPLAGTEVLVLDYDLRHPLFAAAPNQRRLDLRYAPALYDLADRLSNNLGDLFIAVHWRMETVPVQNLAWCAASLVSTLHELQQEEDEKPVGKRVRHVWLATDHPRPLRTFDGSARLFHPNPDPVQRYGPPDKSSTFKARVSEHNEAIEALVEAFQPGGDLDAWTLTDLAEQLHRYPYAEGKLVDVINETLLHDPGVFGILDKLVLTRARAFVTGSTECSKTSSFSKQVIEARQGAFDAGQGKGTIRNVVEYFGQW